jgi:SAM-dependent methyltransferase
MAVSKDEVVWCYRMILGREPESEDIVRVQMKSQNLSSLRETFLRSPEFVGKKIGSSVSQSQKTFLPLDFPKNEIEHDATETQLAECLAKIKAAWSHLGITKPHFSVLTDKQFLPENLDQNVDKFWASGEAEAVQVENMLARHDFTALSTKTCLEYGCGVGRVTMGLARRFAQVHGYDISQGHLSQAEQRAQKVGVFNCRYHLCSDNLLDPLEACDFFYSRIVFQHNPPPIIHQLIRSALRALKPDGIAIFQVPTYRIGYRYPINEWLSTDHALDMQMHCLSQKVIFSIIADENCEPLEAREDNSTGAPDRFISNTFVVRKQA